MDVNLPDTAQLTPCPNTFAANVADRLHFVAQREEAVDTISTKTIGHRCHRLRHRATRRITLRKVQIDILAIYTADAQMPNFSRIKHGADNLRSCLWVTYSQKRIGGRLDHRGTLAWEHNPALPRRVIHHEAKLAPAWRENLGAFCVELSGCIHCRETRIHQNLVDVNLAVRPFHSVVAHDNERVVL